MLRKLKSALNRLGSRIRQPESCDQGLSHNAALEVTSTSGRYRTSTASSSDASPLPAAAPGQGRNVTLSLTLAQSCSVLVDMLDLMGEGSTPSQAASVTPRGRNGCDGATVTVPGVPPSVTPRGLQLLDEWALQRQHAAVMGQAAADWLLELLTANLHCVTRDAATAADFLGCSSFLDLVLEVQLLRVSLMEPPELKAFIDSRGRQLQREDSERALGWAELRGLPCLQQPEMTGPPLARCGMPRLWEPHEWHGLLRKQDEREAQWQQRRQQQRRQQQWPQAAPPRRHVIPVAWFEELVRAVHKSSWVRGVTNLRSDSTRRLLCQLGFVPTISMTATGERTESNGKQAYAQMPLEPLPYFQVADVSIEAESHDQGFRSCPQDRGTARRNSWTWAELILVRVGPGDQPVRPPGDPGRLFKTRHAVGGRQTHRTRLGPDSQMVQDLNERAFAAPRAAAAAEAPAAGAGGCTGEAGEAGARAATAAAAGESGPGAAAAGEGDPSAAGGTRDGGYALQLDMCAAFPGWVCFVSRATITLELRHRPA